MLGRLFALFFVFISTCFSITVVAPVTQNVSDGDAIDLGTIGPGQTVSVLVDPKVNTGGIFGIGGTYDMAVAHNLPDGWASEESKLYQNPLQVRISADPDAPEGNYSAWITVVDEYNGEELGNITFVARVNITWDVMDFNVTPSEIDVGPSQPASFMITIINKGSTSDVFEVSATGPKKWKFKKPVFVPAKSNRTISYELSGDEEETYPATIHVISKASSNIESSKNVTMNVRSGLFGDYRATNKGVILFPIFEAPIYALAGLISNLLP